MKVTFKKDELLLAITNSLGCVSTEKTIGAIDGILLTTIGEEKCQLCAYDLEKGIKIMIDAKVERTDVEVFYIPATQMAKDEGIGSLANMIIVGQLLENHPELSFTGAETVVDKLVPPKKEALKALNMKALEMGKSYK